MVCFALFDWNSFRLLYHTTCSTCKRGLCDSFCCCRSFAPDLWRCGDDHDDDNDNDDDEEKDRAGHYSCLFPIMWFQNAGGTIGGSFSTSDESRFSHVFLFSLK